MTIGKRIKKMRKAKGLTQQVFANKIGSTQNAIARYAISTSNNENTEYLIFSFNLKQDKVFHIMFDPAGWFWNEIKDNDGSNHDKAEKTSEFCSYGEFDKINFRFPDSGFMKFARMTEEEKEKYISDYVDDIESRLTKMQL